MSGKEATGISFPQLTYQSIKVATNSLNLVVNAIDTNDSLKSIVTKGPVIINGADGTKEKNSKVVTVQKKAT